MERDEKQLVEEPREGAGVAEDHEAATKGAPNDAQDWGGTEDPASYLKPSDEE